MSRRALIVVAPLALAGAAALLLVFAREPLPDKLADLPAFTLTAQDGRAFGSAELRGKVAVVNFIFTRCPTVCPLLTARMATVQEELAGEPLVHLVSISVDPAHDTPEVLAAFGREHGQDPARWTFLTGDLARVKQAVEHGFKIGMTGAGAQDPFDIVHGEHFVLVDAEGGIRGYYRTPEKLEALVDDARRLARR